jgi:hypothetical protein
MEIDGLDWMVWLHRLRERREQKRKEQGISEVDWLRQSAVRAREFREQSQQTRRLPVARDRPRNDD